MSADLRRVLDALPGMVFAALPDGNVDFVNQGWTDFTGTRPGTLRTSEWKTTVHPDDLSEMLGRWQCILASGEAGEMETRLHRADGQYRRFVVRCNPLRDDAGSIVQWYGIATETQHLDTNSTPQRQTSDFQLIVDSIPVPVAVTTPSGDVEDLNEPALAYFGKTLDELKSWKATEVVHPDDLERTIADQLEAHRTGTTYNVESRHLRADGVYRWHNVIGLPLRDREGRIQRWFHLLVDIDDRKRAEMELAEREREARLVLDSIPAGIGVLGATGEVEAVNRHLLGYYGRTVQEIHGWGTSDMVHPHDLPGLIDAVGHAVATGTSYEIEVRLRRSDGVHRWFQVRGHPFRNDNGQIVRWYALHIDIDERKRAEEALRDSEVNLRKIINALPTTVWTTRPDGYCEFLNDRWLDYAGFTSEQGEGWGWASVLHPDDKGVIEQWKACLASGTPVDLEARMRGSDGEYRWFLFRANLMRDDNGDIIKWFGTNIDIEDRKRAESALAERERESRLIVDGIAGMIALFSPEGELNGGNQQLIDYFQLPLEDLNNWATNGITHPDDLQVCIDSFMRSIVTGEPYDYETRFLRFDGVYRWFQLRGLPLRDADGKIVRWYGLLTDIDDRKRTEEQLRRSEAFLADAQRLSKTGSFSLRIGTDEITWSEETYRIFDVEPSSTVTMATVLARVHPDSLPTVQEVMDRASQGSGDFDYEIRLQMSDHSIKNVHVLAHSERNKDGDQELVGAVQDVTESRSAEEALNKARSELAYVSRVTSLGVLTASIAHEVNQPLAGIITNANTCLRMLAVEPPNIDVARETARRTIRDGNRAADVIVRLRALFGKQSSRIEAIDLNEIAQEVIALSLGDLQRSRILLQTEFGEDLPRVAGARIQLQQVIMNLLRNAIEATASVSDRARHVVIRTAAGKGDDVKLSVQDTGIGFELEEAERIFDAFYTTKDDGMGIGLSVSRSILEGHGGRLWAQANTGPGVTVSFSVPAFNEAALSENPAIANTFRPGAGTLGRAP